MSGKQQTDKWIVSIKGQILNGQKHPGWSLTAEDNSGDAANIVAEYIIDGTTVKIGSGRLASVVNDVIDHFAQWAPKKDGPGISVDKFTQYGLWELRAPTTFSLQGQLFGPQVTAALPLEAIQNLFVMARKTKKRNDILTTFDRVIVRMHLVEAAHLKGPNGVHFGLQDGDLTDDFLGFLSMVTSYAKGADSVTPTVGPKMILPIMARTDHATIYSQISSKLSGSHSCPSLYSIIRLCAMYTGDGTNHLDDKWQMDGVHPQDPVNIEQRISDESSDILRVMKFSWDNDERGTANRKSSLLVKDWIDGLQHQNVDLLVDKDRTIDGQIGKLRKLRKDGRRLFGSGANIG